MEKRRRSAIKPSSMTSDEASTVIKRLASKNKVRIRLTEDQLAAILDQWIAKDPREPAEITFYVGRKPAVNLKVAAYYYRGDTCCV